jgi:Tfp pilus assembly protein PilO
MNTQRKIYLTLVILAVVIIVLLFFLIRPLVAKVKAVSDNFIEKNNSLASFEERGTDYLARLRGEYLDIESQIPEINKYFLFPNEVIDFILAIEEIATLSSNYQEIKEVGSSEEDILSFQILLRGNFPNLIKFLARLENMEYFIDIHSLQITRITERERSGLEKEGIMVLVGDVKSTINIGVYVKY